MKIKTALAILSLLLSMNAWAFKNEKTALELLTDAENAKNEQKWQEATEFLLEALKINPNFADAHFMLAECAYELDEVELCLERLEETEKYEKASKRVQNLRGHTLMALGKFEEAKKIFENILKKEPNDIEGRFGLAELDLFFGRLTGAEKLYLDSLKRESTNKKALLSLAFVSSALGKTKEAIYYTNKALRQYSDSSDVHYFASLVYSNEGNIEEAEKQCKTALEINPDLDAAYTLLSKIMFKKGEWQNVIDLCDFALKRNGRQSEILYLKGAANLMLNKAEEAISSWFIGLETDTNDEVMRAALELLVNTLPVEDTLRAKLSRYHIEAAREYERKFDSEGAIYEYTRALKVDPDNLPARSEAAKRLAEDGRYERYYEELLFLQAKLQAASSNNNAKAIKIDDTVEAYSSLLSDTMAKSWKVKPLYLNKQRWKIGIFHKETPIAQPHVNANAICAAFISDIFSINQAIKIKTYENPVDNFAKAYRAAREDKQDYFIIIKTDQSKRDFMLEYEIFNAFTGEKIAKSSLYNTGNFEYANTLRRFRENIKELLPVRTNVIDRKGNILLLDIGKTEGIKPGCVLEIVKQYAIRPSPKGLGVYYKTEDILGKCVISKVSEEISEAEIESKGFYDRINTGDEAVLVFVPVNKKEKSEVETQDEKNELEPVSLAELQGKRKIISEDIQMRHLPSLIDTVRKIY